MRLLQLLSYPVTWIGGQFLTAMIAVVGLLLTESSFAANNLGLGTIPLTINNNSGSTRDLYISIVGVVGSTWYSVVDLQGDVQPTTYSPTPTSFALDLGSARTIDMQLPQLAGMRYYFSLGKPLLVNTSPQGIPGAPAGWVPSDVNFNTVFDWVEATWVSDPATGTTNLGANVTQVDMFGIPIRLEIRGLGSDLKTLVSLTSGFAATPTSKERQKIFQALQAAGSPWSSLIMLDPMGSPLRAISPYHGIELGVFPAHQLDSYIQKVFNHYKAGGLTVSPSGVEYVGITKGNALVFVQPQTGASFQFLPPTTYQVYTGNLAPNPTPTDPSLEQIGLAVGALLQGAFLRSTLLVNNNLEGCITEQFYVNSPVNRYARILHANALNNLAYAFGFDDTCSQSSFIDVHNPISSVITIGPVQ